MSISGCDISFSESVRNLVFYVDETLSMDAHIKYLCRFCSASCADWKYPLLTTKWVSFHEYKIMQPDLPSVSPDMQVQQHRSEHSTGFQWRLIQDKIVCLCFQCIYQNCNATLYFWLFSSILSLYDAVLSWHLSDDSSSLLSWHLWEEIFLCFWIHNQKLTTTNPQKNTAFYNF